MRPLSKSKENIRKWVLPVSGGIGCVSIFLLLVQFNQLFRFIHHVLLLTSFIFLRGLPHSSTPSIPVGDLARSGHPTIVRLLEQESYRKNHENEQQNTMLISPDIKNLVPYCSNARHPIARRSTGVFQQNIAFLNNYSKPPFRRTGEKLAAKEKADPTAFS